MQRTGKWLVGVVAVGATGAVLWSTGVGSAITSDQTFRLHERDTGNAFLDLGAKGPSIGDELVGSSALTDASGASAGTDNFVCTSVTPDDRTYQCSVVYALSRGRITAQGQATITGTHPLFDEQVAVTGGTRAYQNARGQVRILQSSETHAELTFHLLP
jgi:hypothetical protein